MPIEPQITFSTNLRKSQCKFYFDHCDSKNRRKKKQNKTKEHFRLLFGSLAMLSILDLSFAVALCSGFTRLTKQKMATKERREQRAPCSLNSATSLTHTPRIRFYTTYSIYISIRAAVDRSYRMVFFSAGTERKITFNIYKFNSTHIQESWNQKDYV